MVGSPRFTDHWLTSCRMVGEAYASIIATVWPAPSNWLLIPYAPLIWSGVWPRTTHGAVFVGVATAVKPFGKAYGDDSSPQKADSGGALRKPGDGGAFLSATRLGVMNCALSSRPTTPLTTVASVLGIVTSDEGARTTLPWTRYMPNEVPKAASAC